MTEQNHRPGLVSLVGAGPGAPGLITVLGLERLRRADCVLYDALAPAELLCQTKPGCECIPVGKLAGRHTLPQDQINVLLAEQARAHRYVVRLKGGDCYVFGRGGEEAAFLRAAGIPFEVIPGVSSAVGGLAWAGLPVTHRGVARGFRVMTASDRSGGMAHLDFDSMARTDDTLVFLMGRSRLAAVCAALLAAGKDPATPAALVGRATLPDQKLLTGTLASLPALAETDPVPDPAILAVGPTLALQPLLAQPFGLSLAGQRLLLPATGENTARLAGLLADSGAAVDLVPVGRIVPIPGALNGVDLAGPGWIVFGSQNAVHCLFEALDESGRDARALAGRQIAAVGHGTAAALRQHGIRADLVPDRQTAAGLADALQPLLAPGTDLLLPMVEGPAAALPGLLQEHCRVRRLLLYKNEPLPAPDLPARLAGCDAVVFTCASAARRTAAACGADALRQAGLVSIGPRTTTALRELLGPDVSIREAAESSYEGILRLLTGAD
ncbi:MAG: uroporphyrinogen-III C-methyltransferase [Oscillospiraceae bacterium]|nr:uroporphyrinogen-III C-methyltransferase [Oscillospiraceae bacterium]